MRIGKKLALRILKLTFLQIFRDQNTQIVRQNGVRRRIILIKGRPGNAGSPDNIRNLQAAKVHLLEQLHHRLTDAHSGKSGFFIVRKLYSHAFPP